MTFSKDEREAEGIWRSREPGSTACLSMEDEHAINEETEMDPDFILAFDGSPHKCTPVALSMFLAHKCFNEDLGRSTASAIHAAFLRHYDTM